MSYYSDYWKDPRWQKKRLEIFERDEWKCQECQSTTETLCVHHKKYTAPVPWEQPDEDLITLCEGCHELEEATKKENPAIYRYAKACNTTCIDLVSYVRIITYLKIIRPDEIGKISDTLAELWQSFTEEEKKILREHFN
jgi:hypothetical protein